jgi:hypothetical protein
MLRNEPIPSLLLKAAPSLSDAQKAESLSMISEPLTSTFRPEWAVLSHGCDNESLRLVEGFLSYLWKGDKTVILIDINLSD